MVPARVVVGVSDLCSGLGNWGEVPKVRRKRLLETREVVERFFPRCLVLGLRGL